VPQSKVSIITWIEYATPLKVNTGQLKIIPNNNIRNPGIIE
jgi:hypothetical protein